MNGVNFVVQSNNGKETVKFLAKFDHQSNPVKASQTQSNQIQPPPSPLLTRDPYRLPKSLAGNSQS
jgi:hypothetical protein